MSWGRIWGGLGSNLGWHGAESLLEGWSERLSPSTAWKITRDGGAGTGWHDRCLTLRPERALLFNPRPANPVRDTTKAVRDATNVVRDATKAVRDATNVVRGATKAVRDATNVVRDICGVPGLG